jgi:transposase InsO family protein
MSRAIVESPVISPDMSLAGDIVEIFYTLKEAQVLIEEWRLEYNTFRPHSSLKYRPPAPEAWLH